MIEAILPIIKEFGFPISLCVVLLWAIRAQNRQLVKSQADHIALLVRAYTDRIGTLEKIVKTQGDKIDELEKDRIRRSDEYGHTLKSIAVSWSKASSETTDTLKGVLKVLRELCEVVRDYRPHDHRTPSPSDVPADPAKRETHPISKE